MILHVLPHRGGGAETYIDMLESLPDFEHHRFYLSSGRTPASAATSLPLRWPRLGAWVRNADIVHTHGDAATVITLPLLRARPTVITTHGLNLLRRLIGVRGALMTKAFATSVGAAETLICTSPAEQAEVEHVVREQDRRKLRVIPNGIDPQQPVTAHDRAAVRSQLGIDDDTVLGLFVGELDPNKAPLLAASAALAVRAAGIRFVLAFAGTGSQAAQLATFSADAVRALGYRSDVPLLLGAADVFVHPSEREGMSFALLEAMARSLPVIAADSPGARDALGNAGLMFAMGDESALVERLAQASADPALRASLGARAKARALHEFSAASFRSATAEVYMQARRRPHRSWAARSDTSDDHPRVTSSL
jgi:glycosyltransferase involved in cell wall biosynthesis